MVRFVTVTIPLSKGKIVSPLIRRLEERGTIANPQTHIQHCVNLTLHGIEDPNEKASPPDQNASASKVYTIAFKTKDKNLEKTILSLQRLGVGEEFGQIDVLPLVLSKPSSASQVASNGQRTISASDGAKLSSGSLSNIDAESGTVLESMLCCDSLQKQRKYRVSDRMTTEEIASFVDDGNHLTFNYLALLACASLIAGIGLLSNSATSVIASMLVSPLMGPILSITFGLATQDKDVILKGIRNEIIGIVLSFVVGLSIGVIAAFSYSMNYRSAEIVGRGTAVNLIGGALVAFASGIAVILGITMGGVNAIVGTAISASLLPPIVNSGICLSMAIIYYLKSAELGSDVSDYFTYSGVSFSLFVVNFIVIVIVGYITLRYVKRIEPVWKASTRESIEMV